MPLAACDRREPRSGTTSPAVEGCNHFLRQKHVAYAKKTCRQSEYFVDKKSKIFRQSEFRQKVFRQSEYHPKCPYFLSMSYWTPKLIFVIFAFRKSFFQTKLFEALIWPKFIRKTKQIIVVIQFKVLN